MEMKTAISCTILRHTKILIAVGVRIISLATLGSKNHTTNITKIVTQSIGIIIKRLDRKSGSAGMPRPISYAVFCLKKKKRFWGFSRPLGDWMSIWGAFAMNTSAALDN